MNIDVEIEGVFDRLIADAIRLKIRRLCRQLASPFDWRVTITPSETRGEWDIGIHAPAGWHVMSFAGPPERLPDVIEHALRERLVLPLAVC